jgi:hypothetical protein
MTASSHPSSQEVTAAAEAAKLELAPFNALATYDDVERAQGAIARLERSFDGAQISLLGEGPRQAARPEHDLERDAGTLKHVARHVAGGAAAGAAGGAALGSAAAAAGIATIAVPGVGVVLGTGLLAAFFGGHVGALVGGTTALHTAPAWELTMAAMRESRVMVGVHTQERADAERALEILQEQSPRSAGLYLQDGSFAG